MELGSDPARVALISAGRGWDFLHAPPDDKPLDSGDAVHVEMVPMVGGYSARTMRCICVGPIDEKRRGAAEKLAALQDEQIAAMRAGAEAKTIDAILHEGLMARGLRESVDNITGYTLGLYAAAGPHTSDFTRIFHPEATWRLETGMVFHMYASAAGVSFSETVLVGPNGPERLTKLPRELMRGA
jgi:Xaa-Pro dipeptidase